MGNTPEELGQTVGKSLEALSAEYSSFSKKLRQFITNFNRRSETSLVIRPALKQLYDSCPRFSESGFKIEQEWVTDEEKEAVAELLPLLVNELQEEISSEQESLEDLEDPDTQSSLLLEEYDVLEYLLFLVGLAETSELDDFDDVIEQVLDLVESIGHTFDGITTNYISSTIYESRAFSKLLYSQEVPEWMRLNILLNCYSENLAPEDRDIIADYLADPSSFIMANLFSICTDVGSNPEKYTDEIKRELSLFLAGELDKMQMTPSTKPELAQSRETIAPNFGKYLACMKGAKSWGGPG